MSEEAASNTDIHQLIARLEENLENNGQDWKTRRELVSKLGQAGMNSTRDSQVEILQVLMDRCYEKEDDQVYKSAMEAVIKIWEAAWDTHRQTILNQVFIALDKKDTNTCDFTQLREQVAGWIGSQAEIIAQDERMIGQVLDVLIQSVNEDRDVRVRAVAWESSRKIWDASWKTRENQESHRLAVINRFLKVFRIEEEEPDDWEVRKAASDWIATRAGDIAKNDRMLNDVVNILIKRSTTEDRDEVSRAAIEALRTIWDQVWELDPLQDQRFTSLNQLEKALNKGSCELKQAAADWMGNRAEDIAAGDRLVAKALKGLVELAMDKKGEVEARQSARENCQKIWNAAWKIEASQEIVLIEVIDVLNQPEDDELDKEFRQIAAEWIGDKAHDIARSERMVDRMLSSALKALTIRANYDSDDYTRRIAETSLRKIWDAGWEKATNDENRQISLIDQVLEAFNPSEAFFSQPVPAAKKAAAEQGMPVESEKVKPLESYQTRMTAVDWLNEKAVTIAGNRRISDKVLYALINYIGSVKETVRSKTIDTITTIWTSAWNLGGSEVSAAQATSPTREKTGVLQADQASRLVVLDRVLRDALQKADGAGCEKIREAAADWLAEHARDIATNERMLTESLNALFSRVNKFEIQTVRRSAREASKKLWDEGWNAFMKNGSNQVADTIGLGPKTSDTRRILILNQVLKVLDRSDNENFKLLAVSWLGDNSTDLAENYNMAEKVADALDAIRQNRSHNVDVIDGANRSIASLWAALGNLPENSLETIQKSFDLKSENKAVEVIRKLANENTLGSREAVSFLITEWTKWIKNNEQNKLVELTAEEIRYNKHAVLPLLEHFLKSGEESQPAVRRKNRTSSLDQIIQPGLSKGSVEAATLRVRQRIARQLADMSDPRFYDQDKSYSYEGMLQDLRDHAIPALTRQLPEEKDVEILENIARVLLNTQDREGINALTREVVGEERTRKARQDLLATYYLQPSKESSDQAADILKKAINESKRTLMILQTLNIAVVIVGLAVLFYGLYFSIMGDAAATRILGGLAAIGGLSGVVYQLVRDPLDRIQNANSNMVQMETAFTSFIWELNLNGTFIQSAYVNNGELSKDEINRTDKRIEEAMKQTMSLVSIFTEQGKQRLVTRLNHLEPGGGKAGETEITINGQYLLGDIRPETASAGNGNHASGAGVRDTGNRQKGPLGMVAINHNPIEGKYISAWEEEHVRFKLPADMLKISTINSNDVPLNETVWISLYIDGLETNALPFHVIQGPGGG